MPRFAALAAAGALTLAVVASVPAWADDAPIIGSEACDSVVAAAVALDADVITATKVASPLVEIASLPDATEADKAAAETATKALADITGRVRSALELDLCVPLPVDPEPTPTTEPPVETTDPTPVETTTPEPTTTAPTTIVTQINGDVTVNPTADDGSVPTLSGTQVTVAPEGSASTGA